MVFSVTNKIYITSLVEHFFLSAFAIMALLLLGFVFKDFNVLVSEYVL